MTLERHLRRKAATKIYQTILDERAGRMHVDRNGRDYIRTFLGLSEMFSYIRSLSSTRVLDCGAGTTRGIADLSNSTLMDGLSAYATILQRRSEQTHIGLVGQQIFRTPAETLKKANHLRYGGIMCLNSIAYSDTPELVVDAIDTILVDGGVVKATFISPVVWNIQKQWSTHHAFSRLLQQYNYGIGMLPNVHEGVDVILAVKNKPECIAQHLLNEDYLTWQKQVI
ncbi:hypothetical protein HY468_03875 [Candidatus Roizmanbacteria bacterium]|nr:hypothetical protein [Candidatus Roizmanbacteria bacterium]